MLKSEYMVLRQVSGDTRVADSAEAPTVNKTLTEIILESGDIIKAKCPIEDVVNVTLDLKEGVS